MAAELESRAAETSAIQKRVVALSADFACDETMALEKDCAQLVKKQEGMAARCERTQENVLNALEALLEEAALEQQRWLAAAHEKVKWCSDVAGDKYSIEAKLATIHELLATVEQGAQLTEALVARLDVFKAATAASTRQQQLDSERQQAQDAWKAFLQQLNQTK